MHPDDGRGHRRDRHGGRHRARVAPRLLLATLRDELRYTGTHVGCEHGVCGACTVLLDGEPVRSCLMFAVQADGARVTTVEGLAPTADRPHPLQAAFRARHALQCGFCTPGILMTLVAYLAEHPRPTGPRYARRCPATSAVPGYHRSWPPRSTPLRRWRAGVAR